MATNAVIIPAVIRRSIFLFISQITKKEHCHRPSGYIGVHLQLYL
jgi:hypothetical protein